MENGNVKWFDPQKGFGLIQPDHGGRDVFVDMNSVKATGLALLKEGKVVFYELVRAGDRDEARDLEVV
ncbi:cold shock domain-containing protein [Breoghania sp.]|uniref:cold-shock protein n=1 Tax=Breoghania sp. TaxID=2065378 RepID=UPI002611BCE0|nr:cold shock domain-containing protein [Breoghania sp.]MDJ0932506.1 cold shock domain-containing protein [Breoghania sp.]